MINSNQRKQIEGLVLTTMDKLDPTGYNTKQYKEMFTGMSNEAFSKYIESIATDEDSNFYLSILPWENEPSLIDIKSAADFLKIDLDEYVYFPDQSTTDGKSIRTPKPVPVGYLYMRRLQQVLMKKNSQSIDTKQRNPITGQVSGDSKVARDSDSENYALTTIGADEILRELHGPRADNIGAMNDMYRDISMQGYVRNADLTQDIGKKTTLNTFDIYIMGAGLKSDLLTTGDKMYWTKRKEAEQK
jgi:hypothetical protein